MSDTPAYRSIALENMSKRFGAHVVFENADATFEHGRVHCIMGASGAGKTTLLRLLMRLDTPDGGHIAGMDGLRCAAVFQEDRLCENLSVAANIRMTHRGSTRAGKNALLCRCDDLLSAMGLHGALERPVRELSGGQKRRVAIARAVLADADVLFFDEALKGLDDETEAQVMRAIAPLLAGKTVFWSTHRARELSYFDTPSLVHVEALSRADAEQTGCDEPTGRPPARSIWRTRSISPRKNRS